MHTLFDRLLLLPYCDQHLNRDCQRTICRHATSRIWCSKCSEAGLSFRTLKLYMDWNELNNNT